MPTDLMATRGIKDRMRTYEIIIAALAIIAVVATIGATTAIVIGLI
jgi:hypothetical protein